MSATTQAKKAPLDPSPEVGSAPKMLDHTVTQKETAPKQQPQHAPPTPAQPQPLDEEVVLDEIMKELKSCIPENSANCHLLQVSEDLVAHLRQVLPPSLGGKGLSMQQDGRTTKPSTAHPQAILPGSPSGRRPSIAPPVEEDNAMAFSEVYLSKLKDLMSSMYAQTECRAWEELKSFGWCESYVSQNLPHDSFLRSKWLLVLLKLHQLCATVFPLIGPCQEEHKSPQTKDRSTTESWVRSAQKDTNAVETVSMWSALTAEYLRLNPFDTMPRGHPYMDYHSQASFGWGDSSTAETTPKRATEPKMSTFGKDSLPSALEKESVAMVKRSDVDWSGFSLYAVVGSGLWTEDADQSDIEELQQIPSTGYKRGVMWNLGKKRIVVCVDADYLAFATSTCGRYDAYLWSLTLHQLEGGFKCGAVPVNFPKFIPSWEMVRKRAAHAVRTYRAVQDENYVSSARYDWLVQMLTGSADCVNDALADMSDDLWNSQFCPSDCVGSRRLETLLVALLGHSEKVVRAKASVLLNVLYDRHDWQQSVPFVPVVRSVDDRFLLEITIDDETNPETNPDGPEGVFLIVRAPSFVTTARCEVYSNHSFEWRPAKSHQRGSRGVFRTGASLKKMFKWRGVVDFGVFPRCGFYDWRVVRADPAVGSWQTVHSTLEEVRRSTSVLNNFTSNFKLPRLDGDDDDDDDDTITAPFSVFPNPSMWGGLRADTDEFRRSIPLQGRFVVQSSGIKAAQVHEVFVDEHGAVFTANNLKARGSFSSIAASLHSMQGQGITTLQLIGTAARDNGKPIYNSADGATFEREDASPFAVTCRASPNEMLGGHEGFTELMQEARRTGVRIFIDVLARVASARPHRKYWPYILHSLDDQGKRTVLYGTDGRSVQFEENCQLNYRDAGTWNLLLEDITRWVEEYEIDGVKLDNAHSWPTIYLPRDDELTRRDADGARHYTLEEQLLGKVVHPFSDQQTGFWETSSADRYPNPLFVKICSAIWRKRSRFTVVGEVGGGVGDFDRRPAAMARSGVVPQLQGLPHTLSKIFGKKITEGRVEVLHEPSTIVEFREWFDQTHETLPEGAIAIQSSCSHTSPYPALLYGRGAWPAVDLLFFMPDVPATFGGETEGKAYRLDITNVFEVQSETTPTSTTIDFDPKTGVRRLPSSSTIKSAIRLKSSTNLQSAPLTQIRGLTSFESLNMLAQLEQEAVKAVGPEYGFDLTKINLHYNHRRSLRQVFRIFREGALIPLRAHSNDGITWQDHVLAFARFDTNAGDFAIVLINFSDKELQKSQVSLKCMGHNYFSMGLDATAMFEYVDLFELPKDFGSGQAADVGFESINLDQLYTTRDTEHKKGIISLAELLSEPQIFDVKPYASVCFGFRLISKAKKNAEFLQRLYSHSLTRFENLVSQVKNYADRSAPRHLMKAIESNFIYASLSNAILPPTSLDPLADVLHHLHIAVEERDAKRSDGMSFYRMLVDSGLFVDHAEPYSEEMKRRDSDFGTPTIKKSTGALLFAKLQRILQGTTSTIQTVTPAATTAVEQDKVALATPVCGAGLMAKHVLDSNALGPIVFVTSELGKWSTVGGLGVMVDELSCTLAQEFGQEVWVISPYYHQNRKGETGYLAKDDVNYRFNIEITVGGENFTLGVHEGTVRGVRLFFLHNERFFPRPYPDMGPRDTLFYLSVMGKGALETLCHVRHIPQVLVTNDWPTGLLAAFAKHGHFGDAFNQTTFFHIIHNLDPSYEGRIYPDRREDLTWIPGLPRDLIIDPTWAQFLYNPSRCAIITCDAWGTVSPSYKNDIIGEGSARPSPLSPILKRIPNPFAFPNGIPIRAREEKIRELKTPTHETAKEYLQKKYFGFEKVDESIPLFAFIGRITEQKGVHLICEAAESVIPRYQNKIQFLVGGMVNWRDPYSARVGRHLLSLRDRYPWSFWAAPNDFFTDGAVVNVGADIGLMPSAFEPGGIVQHEFFVAGTPVLAFCTGGLKDTVFEYNPESQKGNGFNFLSYSVGDLLFAIERACRVYNNPDQYKNLRANARNAVMSSVKVGDAWLHEFCRLRGRVALHPGKVGKYLQSLPQWSEAQWLKRHSSGVDASFTANVAGIEESPSPPAIVEEVTTDAEVRQHTRPNQAGPIPSGPPPLSTPVETSSSSVKQPSIVMLKDPSETVAAAVTSPKTTCPVTIRWPPPNAARRPRGVAVSGSFDKWAVRRPMVWDPAQQVFTLHLALPPGRFHYKVIVDGVWMINSSDRTEKDPSGNVNNVIVADG